MDDITPQQPQEQPQQLTPVDAMSQPSQQVVVAKKKGRVPLIILGGLVVVLFGLLSAALYLKWTEADNARKETAALQDELKAAKEQKSSDDEEAVDSSMKTYTNEALGFSFTYPATWVDGGGMQGAGYVASLVSPEQHTKAQQPARPNSEGVLDASLIVQKWLGRSEGGIKNPNYPSSKSHASLLESLNDTTSQQQKTAELTIGGKKVYVVKSDGLNLTHSVVFETSKGIVEINFPNTDATAALPATEQAIVDSLKIN